MRPKTFKNSFGFTLIELLVVISVIGLLAAVVLVPLQTARSKSKDGRLISNARQLKALMEIDYNNTSYNFNNSFTLSGSTISLKNTGNYATLLSDFNTYAPSGYTNSAVIAAGAAAAAYSGVEVVIVTDGAAASGSWTTNASKYAMFTKLNNGNYFCIDSAHGANVNISVSSNPNTTACP